MSQPSILIVENEAIVGADLANRKTLGYGIRGSSWRGGNVALPLPLWLLE